MPTFGPCARRNFLAAKKLCWKDRLLRLCQEAKKKTVHAVQAHDPISLPRVDVESKSCGCWLTMKTKRSRAIPYCMRRPWARKEAVAVADTDEIILAAHLPWATTLGQKETPLARNHVALRFRWYGKGTGQPKKRRNASRSAPNSRRTTTSPKEVLIVQLILQSGGEAAFKKLKIENSIRSCSS